MSWNQGDTIALRGFLSKSPNFLEELAARVPKISGDTIEHRAISGAEHAGAEKILSEIREMSALREGGGKSPFITTHETP